MDRIQHDHWYLTLGLELVVRVRRPELERLFPKPVAFFARRCPGPRVQLLGPDLHFDVGVRENVLVPARVVRRAPLRGDDEVTAALRSIEQREYVLVAGLAAGSC